MIRENEERMWGQMKLTVFVWIITFLMNANGAPADRSCESLRPQFSKAYQVALKCLEDSKNCEGPIRESIGVAKQIHECLPPMPAKSGSGHGQFNLKTGLQTPSTCGREAEAWQNIKIHSCLAAWKAAAAETYKHPLPKDDCLNLVAPFLSARDSFQACVARTRLGEDVRMKVEF